MRVIVTGSNGLLGQAVAAAFVDAGHAVTGLDMSAPADAVAWSHVSVDLRDLGAVLQLVRDVDAVAHLAGIPRPVGMAPATVFHTNTSISYNVAEAAVLNGVSRIVYASSMSVLGYPFFEQPLQPAYLPLDSRHPIEAQDAYGLSKWLGEEILAAAVRRCPNLSAVSLRMPWIETRRGFVAKVEARRARARIRPGDLWGYIDSRDAAAAFVAAAGASLAGHSRLFISAADTFMEEETADLVREAYPQTDLRAPLPGHRTIFDLAEAEQAIGFAPRHGWRSY